MVAVSGRLQIRDWTDKDGNKRSITEVVADEVIFVDSRSEVGATEALAEAQNAPPVQKIGEQAPNFTEVSDDGDLPF